MATTSASYSLRTLMNEMTVEIVVTDPMHHRAMRWLGLKCFVLAAWLMGVKAIEVADPVGDVLNDWEERR